MIDRLVWVSARIPGAHCWIYWHCSLPQFAYRRSAHMPDENDPPNWQGRSGTA